MSQALYEGLLNAVMALAFIRIAFDAVTWGTKVWGAHRDLQAERCFYNIDDRRAAVFLAAHLFVVGLSNSALLLAVVALLKLLEVHP